MPRRSKPHSPFRYFNSPPGLRLRWRSSGARDPHGHSVDDGCGSGLFGYSVLSVEVSRVELGGFP